MRKKREERRREGRCVFIRAVWKSPNVHYMETTSFAVVMLTIEDTPHS